MAAPTGTTMVKPAAATRESPPGQATTPAPVPRRVYQLLEHLPIAAGGVSQQRVWSEHPTLAAAVAAKQQVYAQRPELLGCLTIEAKLVLEG